MSQPPSLVGRSSVTTALREALTQAEARRGQLVLLSGEAGIGKSALADFIAREAEARGADVTWGRAWELAEAPPYFPVWPCLRGLGIEPPRGAGAETDAFHLWEQVLEALVRAASQRVVVWLLEDLHAADLLTLDLMSFLALPLRALRVLVVVTVRDQDPRLSDLARRRLARLGRDGHELRPEALGQDDVRALAEAVSRRRLDAGEAAALAEVTGGNPLFVVECARAWRGGAPRPAPSSVRQLVTGRVAMLGETTRRALAAGAVLGRDYSAALVARMSELMPAQIIDHLLPALRAGIVSESGPGQFRFSHILVRDAVEEALDPLERAELHARAERALAAQGDAVDVVVERARHALAALRPEVDAVALALRAAHLLEAQGAHDRAYAMLVRIAEARAAGLPVPASAELDPLQIARVARAAGRHGDADRLCGEALDAARAAADPDRMAAAALGLGADLRPGNVNQTLVAALREALGRLGPAPSLVACRVRARLAAALQPAEDVQVPIAMARQAIADARASGDVATLLAVLHSAGSALVDFAPLDERLAIASELRERAQAAGDRPRLCTAHARLALDHLAAGDFAAWEGDLDRLHEVSIELAHPRYRWRSLLLESMRAIAYGDIETSDRAVVEASQHARVTDDLALTMALAAHQLCKALLLHDDETLRASLSDPLDFAKGSPEAAVNPLLRAACRARLEDRDGTAEELAIVRARVRPARAHEMWALPEAWALAGTPDERRELRAMLAAREGSQMLASHIPMVYEGPIARGLALLDSSLGEHAAADAALTGALAGAEARGHRAWVAQLGYDLGRVRMAAGRPRDALPCFAAAAELATQLGMTGLAMRARARSGEAPVAEVAPERMTLTREGEIWRVEHGARVARVKHSRGLELLARLVERDGEEIHVLALASDVGQAATESDAGELLDARARREYKARLEQLTGELETAELRADLGRAGRLRHERALLEAELARAIGLGGRVRTAASATERARVNVQRRLKDAVARIGDTDRILGDILERCVHTGTYCCFRS